MLDFLLKTMILNSDDENIKIILIIKLRQYSGKLEIILPYSEKSFTYKTIHNYNLWKLFSLF